MYKRQVDDQRIRALQRHHVARLKLIVMQAADILLRHILYGHAVNACRNILRQNIHRVERGDDHLLPIRLPVSYTHLAPWVAMFPLLFIVVTILIFNILGDSLRDVLDPKLKV